MHHRPLRAPRLVAITVSLLLLVAACSSSKTSTAASTNPTATTTTISPAIAAKAYEQPGPHPVGVTTYTLPTGNKVEVWYPAVAGTTGTVSYDIRDFTPPSIKALLTANVPATFS